MSHFIEKEVPVMTKRRVGYVFEIVPNEVSFQSECLSAYRTGDRVIIDADCFGELVVRDKNAACLTSCNGLHMQKGKRYRVTIEEVLDGEAKL